MAVEFRSDDDNTLAVVIDGTDVGWLFRQHKYGFTIKTSACGSTITPGDFVAIANKISELQRTANGTLELGI